MKTDFETLSEDEKLQKIFHRALKSCQNSLIDITELDVGKSNLAHPDHDLFEKYIDELKATIDWLAIKLGKEDKWFYR